MGDVTGISWAHHTQNFWIGCTKVSPGCDSCYAETLSNRYGYARWGHGQPRRLTSEANWKKPFAWNKAAMEAGVPARVFASSLSDLFDTEVDPAWRDRAFHEVIRATPWLDWLVLTKRTRVMTDYLGKLDGWPWPNVWPMTSVENQPMADLRVPLLLDLAAVVHGLSVEPLLGPVALDPWIEGLEWVIVGGESGPDARPMERAWAEGVLGTAMRHGVPVHFKQTGNVLARAMGMKHRKGEDFSEWPEAFRVRQFPPSSPRPDRGGETGANPPALFER